MFPFFHQGKSYQPGTHIRIKRPHGINHHAIIVAGSGATIGPMMIVDNAKVHGVSLRTLEAVAGNDPVEVVEEPESWFQGAYIVNRAQSQIGKPYDLFSQNCEHFATWCYRGKPQSLQLQSFALLGLMVFGLVLLSSAK